MTNRISQKLTLYFALVLLLFALLAGALFSLMFARHTADVAIRDLRAHAETIAQTIEHFTLSYEQGSCKGSGFKSYMRFVGEVAMSDLFLLDAQCAPVTLDEMPPVPLPLPDGVKLLAEQIFECGEAVSQSLSSGLLYSHDLIAGAPIFSAQGNVQYALVLRSPVGSVDHGLRDAFYILSACLFIAMLLAIVVSVFLSHHFVTPLHKMMDAATRLTDGDYRAKTNVQQNDEIGVLAEHIDALSVRLAAAEKERQQLDQMRQDFFSDISHELRTPISVLKGTVELLREGMICEPDQHEAYYDQLYTDATHLERLVNDLLELTRLQNTHFKIEMSVINLIDVLRDTMRFMAQRAAAKQISVHFDDLAGPFPVFGDYTRLRQLMVILLDNAIKFSPAQSAVHITARRTGSSCEVTIADQGCGIDKETLAHIFDRFFHNQSHLNRSGTGLGLPIAKEIALRHHIDISCESTPGEGTCFTLLFAACEIPEE